MTCNLSFTLLFPKLSSTAEPVSRAQQQTSILLIIEQLDSQFEEHSNETLMSVFKSVAAFIFFLLQECS